MKMELVEEMAARQYSCHRHDGKWESHVVERAGGTQQYDAHGKGQYVEASWTVGNGIHDEAYAEHGGSTHDGERHAREYHEAPA